MLLLTKAGDVETNPGPTTLNIKVWMCDICYKKSCELDPLPTWLPKECIAELVPTITDIVNMSLRDSLMPKSLKTALIRPLLKKTGLDSDILKNYLI